MGSIRTAIRQQFKMPTRQDLISEALMRRAQGGLPPPPEESFELFLTNGVQQPGEAVIAQGYTGRGAGLSLSLDWGASCCRTLSWAQQRRTQSYPGQSRMLCHW